MRLRHLCLLAVLLAACTGEITGEREGFGTTEPDASEVAEVAPDEGNLDHLPRSGSIPEVGLAARVVGTGGLRLRLRAGPGTQFAILGLLEPGAVVDVVGGPDGAWFEVALADGQQGWCHGHYLERIDDPVDDPVDEPTDEPEPSETEEALLPWHLGEAHRVTQGHFGPSHYGHAAWAWDFSMVPGTPVLAAQGGEVRLVKGDSTIGGCDSAYASHANYVVVDLGDGTESLYLHLSSVDVTVGETVVRGQRLGLSGATGWACGAHLHYQRQRGPDGGGDEGWYNPSVPDAFYDTGEPLDPYTGLEPVSANQEQP